MVATSSYENGQVTKAIYQIRLNKLRDMKNDK